MTKKQQTLEQIIHKSNSNLSIIKGYAQLLQAELRDNHEQSDWLAKIINEANNLKNNLDFIKKKTSD